MRPGLRFLAACAPAVVAAAFTPSCNGDGEPTQAAPPPPPVTAATVYDAAPPPDGITSIVGFDPASGMHLDDDTPSAHHGAGSTVHDHRTLEILLRSTPSGATVAVDGVIVGKTPGYWEGDFTGREREFTFVMPGYAMARYRFVPTTNGVVHGRLTKIVSDQDAGLPPIPRPEDPGASPAGTPRPDAAPAPRPPPPPLPPPPASDAPPPSAPDVVDAGAPPV